MRTVDVDAFIAKLFDCAITDEDRKFSEDVEYALSKEPTVTIEPRNAEWVKSRCSNCGQQHPVFKIFYRDDLLFEIKDGEANYCPKCGAKMKYAK